MRTLAIIAATFCIAGAALAQAPAPSPAPAAAPSDATAPADVAGATCKTQVGPKNLHGAAQTSFVKKCVSDATAT